MGACECVCECVSVSVSNPMLSVTLHSLDYEKQSLLLHPAKCFFFSWHSASPQQTLSTPRPSIPNILQQAADSCLPRVYRTPEDAFCLLNWFKLINKSLPLKMFILCINQSEKVLLFNHFPNLGGGKHHGTRGGVLHGQVPAPSQG